MKKTDTERAYEAIEQYVRKHVNGDADNAYCACCNFFDRHKDEYDESEGKIEDFARATARSCLYIENNASTRRKDREKVYTESLSRHCGETAEKRHIKRLVEQAVMALPAEARGIIAWKLCGLSYELLADIWRISWSCFYEVYLEPARQRFAKAFGEVVGNPKLYAKLRAEVLAKGKEI